ncbi:hypothetical protein BpHYR1_036570 [Brachionus plicatilis]|uniref:Uncharacterized protein n=1 Tax=Brachionus plicatilis TaxID=10195 RepID=A0A3M7PX98_BRAPC|nr:hypothetical protein BpHYR1_036570 [Brachionus plicatilis]
MSNLSQYYNLLFGLSSNFSRKNFYLNAIKTKINHKWIMTEKLTAIVSSASAGKKFLKSSHQKSQPIGQLEKSNKNRGFPYKQKEFFNENILKRFSMINKKRGKQLNFSPYIVDPSLPVVITVGYHNLIVRLKRRTLIYSKWPEIFPQTI